MSKLAKGMPRIVMGAGRALAGLTTCLAMSSGALAQDEDPPTRVARVAYLEGAVSFEPAGTQDWVAPGINRPLTTGDALWSDQGSRAELQLDGSTVRAGADTSLSFLNLGDQVTQIQLSAGTLIVHVRRLRDQETYEIDTPNLAFTVLQPGTYRLTVDGAGGTTTIDVRGGQGEATGGGVAYTVFAGEEDAFAGTDQLVETQQSAIGAEDPFDAWSSQRDARWEHSVSARYVAPDIVGYEDLDDQGDWRPTSYGNMWFPRGLRPGWAPYQQGHWAYVPPWGYTWVDDNPWGFAPFHYGRWASFNGAWGWIPAPPPAPGAVYVAPVYAPALVAWVGAGAAVAWFALGPREVYVPSYPVSREYVERVNVSNTNVTTTVINNVYKTTTVINNKTVNVTNITYVNRTVPGAVTATSQEAFTSAQPVARGRVTVDARTLAAAPVRAAAPPIVPTTKAVLGAGKPSGSHPPPAVLARPIVARTAPPPPPPSFAERQRAIQGNGGRPLSAAQVRQIQPAAGAAARATPVRQAPAPRTLITSKPAGAVPKAPAAGAPPAKPEGARPAEPARANAPAGSPTHVKETPPPTRPAAPSTAASVLERQQLQEQQQLHAQQEAERQRAERQQEADHQKLAQQQAAEAQRREQEAALEKQHAAQTQEIAQRHAAQQQQLLERQQQQRSDQQVKPAEPKPKPEPKPASKPESKPKTN